MITGGGTGGHLFPALAVAEELRQVAPESSILFVGAEKGIEKDVVPKYGFPLVTLPVRGLARTGGIRPLLSLVVFMRSVLVAVRRLRDFAPDVVLGAGGYSSAPAAVAAILLRCPLVLMEQNSFPGLVTRTLSRWAALVFVSFDKTRDYLAKPDRVRVVGNPVRVQLRRATRDEARRSFGLAPDRPVLLVFGGSQGARAINEAVLEMLPQYLARSEGQVLWSTGPAHHAALERRVRERGWDERVRVLPFIEDMGLAYSACDLALCRAGASTLAELALVGVPSILVPYPYAAEDHQTHNARAFEEAGAAVMLPESRLSPERLVELVISLLEDRERLAQMAAAAQALARPEAARTIAQQLLEIALETKVGR